MCAKVAPNMSKYESPKKVMSWCEASHPTVLEPPAEPASARAPGAARGVMVDISGRSVAGWPCETNGHRPGRDRAFRIRAPGLDRLRPPAFDTVCLVRARPRGHGHADRAQRLVAVRSELKVRAGRDRKGGARLHRYDTLAVAGAAPH